MEDKRHWSLKGTLIGDPTRRCNLCNLCIGVKSTRIGFRGSRSPQIMIVGESPGEDEDTKGSPFQGRSGKLLDQLVKEAGISADKVMFTTVVKCRPIDPAGKNRTPTDEEVSQCSPYLFWDIHKYDPDIIIPLGGTAMHALGVDGKITSQRGRLFNLTIAGRVRKVVPTVHPAALLRGKMDVYNQVISDLKFALHQSEPRKITNWKLINSTGEALKLFGDLIRRYASGDIEAVAYDIETIGLDSYKELDRHGRKTSFLGFALSPREDESYFIAMEHIESKVNVQTALVGLTKLLRTVPIIAHNGMFDVSFTQGYYNIEEINLVDDTLLMDYICFPGDGAHNLGDCAQRHLNTYPWKHIPDEFLGKIYRSKKEQHMGNIPLVLLAQYAAYDAEATRALRDVYKSKLDSSPLKYAYERAMRSHNVFSAVERRGAFIDSEKLKLKQVEYTNLQREIVVSLRDRVPEIRSWESDNNKDFDPANHGHARDLIYNRFNLAEIVVDKIEHSLAFQTITRQLRRKPSLKKDKDVKKLRRSGVDVPFEYTDGGKSGNQVPSTKDLNLMNLYKFCVKNDMTDEAWSIDQIREFKKINKIRTSFFAPMESDRRNGSNNVTIDYSLWSLTGRFRSRLHTAPARSDVRRMYVSEWHEGGIIIDCDYSQIEMRLLACCSRDETLMQSFIDGLDVHTMTASKMFKIPVEDKEYWKTDEGKLKRTKAKTVNFGLAYGRGADALIEAFGMSIEEASEMIQEYFESFPKIKEWVEEQHKYATDNGFIQIPTGRIRWLKAAKQDCDCGKWDCGRCEARSKALREAQNTPIQGAATDVALEAFLLFQESAVRDELKSRAFLFLHDAIAVDVAPGEIFKVCELLQYCMTDGVKNVFPWIDVPLDLSWALGPRWDGFPEVVTRGPNEDYPDLLPNEFILEGKREYFEETVDVLMRYNGYSVKSEIILSEPIKQVSEKDRIERAHYTGDIGGGEKVVGRLLVEVNDANKEKV